MKRCIWSWTVLVALGGLSVLPAQNLQVVGSLPLSGGVMGVCVSGPYAYVASGDSGLRVVNVADSSQPVLLGSVDTPDFARDVVVDVPHAYVAQAQAMQIVTIGDPAAPVLAGAFSTGHYSGWQVSVQEETAYMFSQGTGLTALDVSDPQAPAQISDYHASGAP